MSPFFFHFSMSRDISLSPASPAPGQYPKGPFFLWGETIRVGSPHCHWHTEGLSINLLYSSFTTRLSMSMNAQIIYRNWRHSGLSTDFYTKYSSAYSSSIFAAGELSCSGTQSQGSTVVGIRFGHTKPAETTNLSAPLCLPELKTKEVFMTVLGQLREGRDPSADKIQFCEQTLPGRLRFVPILSWLTLYGHDI